jgi:hypothetical protein
MRLPSLRALAAGVSTLWLALTVRVMAAEGDTFGGKLLEQVGTKAYGAQEKASLPDIVGTLIKTAIGLLGLIFLVLTVYAGYLWLIARGNKEEVQKAKDTLTRGIIGMIIVVSAYAIASFVINRLTK